jgi:pyruvate/2-oxoglutarate dehydrogenase complex dihydrolipoamide acyltransferase (E2) component
MTLLNTILVPQESVNDEFLSLKSIYVKNGQFVESDTLIAELETSKALLEIRAESSGYVKIYVAENTDVLIGHKMFEFYDLPIEEEVIIDVKENNNIDMTLSADVTKSTRFSNAALKHINSNSIDISNIKSNKFITTKDFLPILTTQSSVSVLDKKNITINPDREEVDLKPISKSKKIEFEYLYSINSSSVISRLAIEVSVKSIESIRATQNFINSTPLPTIIHEVSRLLVKYPNLNSYYFEGQQAFYKNINIGFAIDDGVNGLKVASILNTDKLSLNEVEENISDLTTKYSGNQLSIKDLTSATFTITDLFNSNVKSFHPLVNNKNSCILGISSLANNHFTIDVSFDHRISSGKEIALFLTDLKFRLEARFNNYSLDQPNEKINCIKCYRGFEDDSQGKLFFQKVINSKYNGYICSNCLIGW